MMDMVQRSRGFGFVTFENGSGGAQKAIESQPINMFGKMVEVKLATPKGGNAGPFVPQPHHRKPVMSTSSNGEFAGLASSYGRAGWRAGYGSKAFGKAGWNVVGWVSSRELFLLSFLFSLMYIHLHSFASLTRMMAGMHPIGLGFHFQCLILRNSSQVVIRDLQNVQGNDVTISKDSFHITHVYISTTIPTVVII